MVNSIVNLIFTKETRSTNDLLRQMLAENDLPEFTVVQTDFQFSGKGMAGNVWESAESENLLFSILLKPKNINSAEQFIISQMISNAIKNTLDKFATDFTIKWSNDIYWKDKKICGILIENDLIGNKIKHSVIGVGLNINQIKFSEKLLNPVSLKMIINESVSQEQILADIIENLKTQYFSKDFNEIRTSYFNNLYRKNGFFAYQSAEEIFQAKIITVENDGKLILETKSGERRSFYFKEIKFVL